MTFMRLVPGVVGREDEHGQVQRPFLNAVNGGQTLSLEIQLDGAAILGSNLPGDLRIIGFPVDGRNSRSAPTTLPLNWGAPAAV